MPGWDAIDAAIVAATDDDMDNDETGEDGNWQTTFTLTKCICRVALRLEQAGVFEALKRTPDFALAVSPDPREPGDMSLDRMEKFRKAAAKQSSKAPAKPTATSCAKPNVTAKARASAKPKSKSTRKR